MTAIVEKQGEIKPWESKTLWVNFVMALFAIIFPLGNQWVAAHPDALVGIMTGVNVVLRFITKDKIVLKD